MKEHWVDVHLALTYQYDQAEFIKLLKQLADDVAVNLSNVSPNDVANAKVSCVKV